MAEEYSRSLLKVSVAQICQNLGWHSAQSSSLDVLTDVLERYIRKIAVTTHGYTEHCEFFFKKIFIILVIIIIQFGITSITLFIGSFSENVNLKNGQF